VTSPNLEIRQTSLPGVCLVVRKLFRDNRGFFVESFNERAFAAAGLPIHFVQENHSRSNKGVLRGLHYQLEHPQGKLVLVVRGKIFDVVADIRRGSPTFGRWVGNVLDDAELTALWIPPGFAHGFCALSESVDVTYKCTDFYAPNDEHGVKWDDSFLKIKWPMSDPILSEKDRAYPPLSEARNDLPDYVPS
jgi:dTDP-4-dehydrorhamnose 3,5-epimerase